MDVGAPDLAVVLAACASGHQAVAEVDQAAERHKREQDGLLQSDAMGAAGLLLQNGALADVCAHAHVRFLQEDGPAEETALQFNPGPELTIFDGRRGFGPELAAGRYHNIFSVNPAARIKGDAFCGDPVNRDFVADIEGQRIGNVHPAMDQFNDFRFGSRFQYHLTS